MPHKLANVGGVADWLSWSPDGSRIRFALRRTTISGRFLRGGPIFTRYCPAGMQRGYQCCGRWTPDGKYFLFLSERARSGRSMSRAASSEALPGQPIQLTTGPIRWGAPIVSRDGKTILRARLHESWRTGSLGRPFGQLSTLSVGDLSGQRDLFPRRESRWLTSPIQRTFCGRHAPTEATRSSLTCRGIADELRRDGRRMARRLSIAAISQIVADPGSAISSPADGGKPQPIASWRRRARKQRPTGLRMDTRLSSATSRATRRIFASST